MDYANDIVYACERCGKILPQVATDSDSKDPEVKDTATLLRIFLGALEALRDHGGQAVDASPATARSTRLCRRVPVSPSSCRRCNGGNAAAAAGDGGHLRDSGAAQLSALLSSLSEIGAATWSSSSSTTSIDMADGVDYDALHPQPLLEGRLYAVTKMAPEYPFRNDGVPALDAPVVTLTPTTYQQTPSAPDLAPADPTRLAAPSFCQDRGPLFFEYDE
ncbi:hypothetical protein PG994_010398 [Apiospora phragmitis]|uniref:Uncharacterized protein n=1 Tax=Apiospora phragmitis TaxID=2905665 RepID=A0ABR1TPZ6_9PEZI